MTEKNLIFNPQIASQKPNNHDTCPFCVQDNLGKILDQQDDMIWVENKFPTLEHTYQTLIIESSDHLGDISTYPQTHLHQLFRFAFEKWQSLQASGDFKSVLMYRNFGPLSGGSLRHPHTQIVGLSDIAAYDDLSADRFQGITVLPETENQAEILIASKPFMDYTECHTKVSDINQLNHLADAVQAVTDYLLNHYAGGKCSSYNLFFYQFGAEVHCHIVPRFITSPYHIGYNIRQINNQEQLEQTCQDLKTYLEQKKRP